MATPAEQPQVLILGLKFAEYGSNLVTATHKLSELLARGGAKVFVTSLSTDEDDQEEETNLAQLISDDSKVSHSSH